MIDDASRYTVKCLGHDDQRGFTDYLFQVRHSGGCEWNVMRRYQELLELHERLSGAFGEEGLPAFPPRHAGGGVVSALLGSSGRNPSIVAERERGFQKYFDALCQRSEILRTPVLQTALGVTAPEPVSQLRVRGWVPDPMSDQACFALVDIRPEGQSEGSSGVSEAYHIVASIVFRDAATDTEELCPVADFRFPSRGTVTRVKVEGLKLGAEVQIKVWAINAAGQSSPVAIDVRIPDTASLTEEEVARRTTSEFDVDATRTSEEFGTPPSTGDEALEKAASAERQLEDVLRRQEELERELAERREQAAEASAAAEEKELARRKGELEREWAEKLKAASAADAAAEEEIARRRDALERELTEKQKQASEASATVEEELARRRGELEREFAEKQAAAPAASTAGEDELARRREELEREWAEKQKQASAAVALAEQELARRQGELEMEWAEKQRLAAEAQAKAEEELARRKRELEAEWAEKQLEADALREAEAEIQRHAETLARTEQALNVERAELMRSRQSLAVVQAHVVNMLEEVCPGSPEQSVRSPRLHRMDDEADPDDVIGATPGATEVWNMDWASGFEDRRADESVSPVRRPGPSAASPT